MRYLPRSYQSLMTQFMLEHPRGNVFAEMGLGKTVCSLTAVDSLQRLDEVKRPLIVAPLRVTQRTWDNECNKWNHLKHIEIEHITGTRVQRLAALKRDRQMYITNYEQLPWLIQGFGTKRWPFDCVIADESSKLKNSDTKRFKYIRHVLKKITHWYNLTGTPCGNGLKNLWSQTYLLDYGERLGPSFADFKARYFTTQRTYFGSVIVPLPSAQKNIQAKIADISISLRRKDYIKLPEFKIVEVPTYLTARQRKEYNELDSELYSIIQNEGVQCAHRAAADTKCRQYSNGNIYPEVGSRYLHIHDNKLNALGDILDEFDGEPVLIAYNYKPDAEQILKRFKSRGVLLCKNETDIERRWNAGEIPALLMYPGSDGYGLNLQIGGRVAVWFGPTWDLDAWDQFNKRLDRPGQTRPGFIYVITTDASIDQVILDRLASKDSVQKCLMRALRKRGR